jgi:hypothetical protein
MRGARGERQNNVLCVLGYVTDIGSYSRFLLVTKQLM